MSGLLLNSASKTCRMFRVLAPSNVQRSFICTTNIGDKIPINFMKGATILLILGQFYHHFLYCCSYFNRRISIVFMALAPIDCADAAPANSVDRFSPHFFKCGRYSQSLISAVSLFFLMSRSQLSMFMMKIISFSIFISFEFYHYFY